MPLPWMLLNVSTFLVLLARLKYPSIDPAAQPVIIPQGGMAASTCSPFKHSKSLSVSLSLSLARSSLHRYPDHTAWQ